MALEILWLGSILRILPHDVLRTCLAELWRRYPSVDITIVNADKILRQGIHAEEFIALLFESGIDVVTLGEEAIARTSSRRALNKWPHLVRPLNLPPAAPGNGAIPLPNSGEANFWLVSLTTGSERFPVEDPFDILEAFTKEHSPSAIFIDASGPLLSVRKALYWRFQEKPWFVHLLGSGLEVATDDLLVHNGSLFLTDNGIIGDETLIEGLPMPLWWAQRRHLSNIENAAPSTANLRIEGLYMVVEATGYISSANRFRFCYPF